MDLGPAMFTFFLICLFHITLFKRSHSPSVSFLFICFVALILLSLFSCLKFAGSASVGGGSMGYFCNHSLCWHLIKGLVC